MDYAQQPAAAPGKKKRAYADNAFGFGGNAQQAQGPPSGIPPADGFTQPGAAFSPGFPPQGQIPGQSQGQPQGYPAPDQLSGQFAGMNIGGPQAQLPQQPQQIPPSSYLNQLQPSDLINQPFNVFELDQPPPSINLPANTSVTPSPHANCPPKYIRSTLNAVPRTPTLHGKSNLPFALIIQPYTSLHDVEDPIPVVSDQVIARCRRCRSYINSFVTFLDHGHRWRCNMCGLHNDVPQAFDWDAASSQSADRWQRSELKYSVVEFIAPQEYMVRPPQPLVYLFVLDVSYAAVTSGLLATTARCILESLDRIPNADRRTRLGFIAVDSSLHYFSIQRDVPVEEGQEPVVIEPSMIVVSDLEEPFLPTPEDLLVNLSESRRNLDNFLNKLHSMFQDTQNGGSAMGAALRAGHKLVSPVGGKITVLTASLPNIGYGKLEMREDKKILGTAKEVNLLDPGSDAYKHFAVECHKNQISVDMFLFSAQYQDVATLSTIPKETGGQTYFYPAWNAARTEDAIKFAQEFSDYLSAEIGLEAVLRIRATTNLKMDKFFGNFFIRSSDLCAFSAFPRDQSFVVEVKIDDPLTAPFVCMQAAVLHTTCNGERRIRVLTLALPTTDNLGHVYASADQQAITEYYSHKAVEAVFDRSGVMRHDRLELARNYLRDELIKVLKAYRKELAGGNMGGGGLQLPYNLRGLPVLVLGLLKNIGLRKSAQIPSDLRAAALCLLSSLPLPLMMQYIYPKLFSLHDMPDSAGVPDPDSGEIMLPPPCNLSSERLVPYGLYLIDDSVNQFLWVGRDAVPQLIMDVFGTDDKMQLKQGKSSLPILENEFNERVRAVVDKSKDHRAKGAGSITVPSLYIIREDGEPSLKMWAQTLLVEDRADQGVSLQQWMGMLREKVVT